MQGHDGRGGRPVHDDQGQGVHRGNLRAPHTQGRHPVAGPAARRVRTGRAGRRGTDKATTSTATSARATRPGLGPLSMADYMGLKLRHMDTTETGGSSYVIHVAHAAEAIALGKCNVALITLAGRPARRGHGHRHRTARAGRVRARRAVRVPVRPDRREPVRDGGDAPHVRVRHDERAARVDQGGRLAARAAQPARPPARGRHGRRGASTRR
mgnify:CR=1 FL=1